jgi:hypothetical protein
MSPLSSAAMHRRLDAHATAARSLAIDLELHPLDSGKIELNASPF